MAYTTIRVDPEVWARLIDIKARLSKKTGRNASFSDAVKAALQESVPKPSK